MKKTKGFKKAELIVDNIVQFPYVSRSAENNGITNHASNYNNHYPSNTITIHHEWSNKWIAFYQPKDYITDGMIGILKPKFNINEWIGLFIITIINKLPASGPLNKIKDETIKLPCKNNKPDYEYMEKYMKNEL